MREEKMRELMQQELAVPEKVHDAFEKGIRQIARMDTEQADIAQVGTVQKAGQKGRQVFWRRAGLVAAAAATVCVIGFHSQIYSFAKSLFIHDVIKMGDKEIAQETDTKIIKIKDVELTIGEWQHFESWEDAGEKLGISFLTSSMENDVTGKGRVSARMMVEGQATVADDYFAVKDISQIRYKENGSHGSQGHIDSEEAYSISCTAHFYTKTFQYDYGKEYVDGAVIEDYDTANGFHATIFRYGDSPELNAILYCDNIRYEYHVDACDTGSYTVEDFKAFLDTLTK